MARLGPIESLASSLWSIADTSIALGRAGLVGLESHLLERVDAAVMAVDLQGRILFANRYAETLYGWSRDETIGRLAAEVSGVALEPDIAAEILDALANDGSWEGTFEVRRRDGTLLSVHAVNSPLYDSTGQLSGVVSLAIDASRERVERLLVDCSALLGSSLDFGLNLTALAELAVPFLGDICFIDISDDNGGLHRMAAAHADPEKQALIDELGRQYPPDPRGPHPAVEALRSGATFYLSEVTDDVVRALARDDNHYRIVTELGFRSFMCVPLIARGRTLGAVTVISCNPDRRHSADDVEVLTEVARRAAVALDNARLYDDQQRARAIAESAADRLLQLQTLATALSRAVSVDEVAKVIGAIAMPHLGSFTRGVWLVNEAAGTLELVSGLDLRGIESYTAIPTDSSLPAAEVVRTRAPVLVRTLAERDERFPDLRSIAGAPASFAAVPLVAEERTLGVFVIGFEDEHALEDGEVRFLTAVADQCAQALARGLLYDRERLERDRAERDRRRIQALNRALQTSLLPPVLPEIPGVELEARYQPALAGLEVGGDFYDVFDTGGDWAIVIGDVCGKGPEAAAVTAVARWTIRSVAMDIRQPTQVLRKVNEALLHQQLDDRFCTIAYARVVPTSQGVRVSICRGGHPPPLVVRAEGGIEIFGTAGSLIGILPEVRLWEETTQLHTGDALVFYTDGVTEARRGRAQFGEERLLETLDTCHGQSAAEIADCIEHAVLEFAGTDPSDDIAIVVLRVA